MNILQDIMSAETEIDEIDISCHFDTGAPDWELEKEGMSDARNGTDYGGGSQDSCLP